MMMLNTKTLCQIGLSIILFTPVKAKTQELPIIPAPLAVESGSGNFQLSAETVVHYPDGSEEGKQVQELISRHFGARQKNKKVTSNIELQIERELEDSLGNEGYILRVTMKELTIKAAGSAGLFYGLQTLRQLLPVDFEYINAEQTITLPSMTIVDKPRFSWRAFMLDEARNFKGMEVVKGLLDQMARLKMNVFHWHLVDDQGWRIEIKQYPKLTTIGGFRSDTQKSRRSPERTGDPHNGFYTQAQIREIVDYAAARHIRVIPEIEMPGHATAAIVAYPWLGVLARDTSVPVTFGKMDDSYNIAKPEVRTFLKNVLEEIFQLFPDEVVHIGGDEVNFEPWKQDSVIQQYMRQQKMNSAADLQIAFTNEISQFVEAHGKRMMGWNEIMGGHVHEWQKETDETSSQVLAKNSIVHFWKGSLDLINQAVSNGYDIVNSYHAMTYLDYNYKTIPLEKAYGFDPVPEGLDPKYELQILGLGCQMWGEWIQTIPRMNYQIFPRLAAYAEVGWTAKPNKDFRRFSNALKDMEQRWKFEGIEVGKEE